jgi:hypothetical protein
MEYFFFAELTVPATALHGTGSFIAVSKETLFLQDTSVALLWVLHLKCSADVSRVTELNSFPDVTGCSFSNSERIRER